MDIKWKMTEPVSEEVVCFVWSHPENLMPVQEAEIEKFREYIKTTKWAHIPVVVLDEGMTLEMMTVRREM